MTIEELKIELYLRLLKIPHEAMTSNDTDIMFHLSNDPAIQRKLEENKMAKVYDSYKPPKFRMG